MAKITAPLGIPDQYGLDSCIIFFQGYQTMVICNPDGSNPVYYDITQETRLEVSGGMLNISGNTDIGATQSPDPNYNMLDGDNLGYDHGIVIGTGDVRNFTGNPQVDYYALSSNPITVMYNGNHICRLKYISRSNNTLVP
jgi:hypothetical protein